MNNALKWYAVYTRPRWEKKVADFLTRQNIENYCPLNKVQRQWSDRKKIVLEPLFQSYVFVRINDARSLNVKQTDGIINFVNWLRKPAVIRDEEIELIKLFLNDHINVRIEQQDVNIHDRVRIISGPLMTYEGNVLEIRHKTVKVILPSLGCTMVAEVAKENVKRSTA